MRRTWVSADLYAFHTDHTWDEGRHAHRWTVKAWFNADPPRDARSMRASLSVILDAWQSGDLPAELWAAEDLAAALLQLHGNADCIGVTIERAEGFGAEAWRD